MGNFKKSSSLTGKYKAIMIQDGNFVDTETGSVINLAEELGKIYKEESFDLSTSSKTDEDLEVIS